MSMKTRFEKNGIVLKVKVENGLAVRFSVVIENMKEETFELNEELPYDSKQAELAEQICEAFDEFGYIQMALAIIDHEITSGGTDNLQDVLNLFHDKMNGLESWREYHGLKEAGKEIFCKKVSGKVSANAVDYIMNEIGGQTDWQEYALENMDNVYGMCQSDMNSDIYYMKI